eukprot:scaffold317719_cov15-Tisochrysis_lutea.AAC.1
MAWTYEQSLFKVTGTASGSPFFSVLTQLSVLPSLQFSGHTAPPPLDQSQSPPSRRLGVCRQDAF